MNTTTGIYTALTERERTMLQLAAQGYTDREAGKVLGLAHRTVRNCWCILTEKYHARNRTEAVVRAWIMGDIPPTIRRWSDA